MKDAEQIKAADRKSEPGAKTSALQNPKNESEESIQKPYLMDTENVKLKKLTQKEHKEFLKKRLWQRSRQERQLAKNFSTEERK